MTERTMSEAHQAGAAAADAEVTNADLMAALAALGRAHADLTRRLDELEARR